MKRIVLSGILIGLLAVSAASGQGIEFSGGSLARAMEKAQAEGKHVFIDFYTVWCGPCKAMAKNIFTDAEVGAYFNGKFVSCQLNAEDKALSGEVKKYGVQAYPTLIVVDPAGRVLNRQVGACDVRQLLRFGRIACGEQLSFEQMYEQLKVDKNKDELVRSLLLEAPEYLVRLEGGNRDRWELRVESIYNDYRKRKPVAEWMNPDDFKVLMLYHTESSASDEVLNYVIAHYDEVARAVGQTDVCRFTFSLHMALIEDQARRGDLAYLESLEQVRGGLWQMYDSLMNFGGKEVYTGLKYLYDGYYYVYSKKDVDKYFQLMDEYATYLGKAINGGDYIAMANALSEAVKNKMTPAICAKCVEWLGAALQCELSEDDRLNCLIMLGDSYKGLKDIEMARKCYNQAYLLSLQFDNPGLSAAVQGYVKQLEE